MEKTFVLDANVLLHDPQALYSFKENKVVIIISVLAEIDSFKKNQGQIGANAREIARELDKISKEGNLYSGIKMKNGGTVFVYPFRKSSIKINCDQSVDNNLLCEAAHLIELGENATIVSKDIILRVMANGLGIPAEDYETDKKVVEFYNGYTELSLSDEEMEKFCNGEQIKPEGFNGYPNEYIIISNSPDTKKPILGKTLSNGFIVNIKPNGIHALNIRPKNVDQIFALDALFDDEIKIVTLQGLSGTGKAQPLDSLVLTPNGYVKMRDIHAGDFVVAPDGDYVEVLSVHPQGKLDVFMVKFSDGSYTECCNDHLWDTQTVRERWSDPKKYTTRSLREISSTLMVWNGRRPNHYIPLVSKNIHFLSNDLKLDPYVLGCLIGDGSMANSSITFSTGDDELLFSLSSYLSELGLSFKRLNKYDHAIVGKDRMYGGGTSRGISCFNDGVMIKSYPSIKDVVLDGYCSSSVYRCINGDYSLYRGMKWSFSNEKMLSNNFIKNELINLGLFGKKSLDKFLPDSYKYSSFDSRLSLLQGLMDTDGGMSKNSCEFYTSSLRLSEDVRFLVESLGGLARATSKIKKYRYKGQVKNGNRAYILRITLPPEVIPFRLSRKLSLYASIKKKYLYRNIIGIESIGKKECQCILVKSKDHRYITNNFIVTHNTLLSCASGIAQMIGDKYFKLSVTRPVIPVGRDMGFLPGDIEDKMKPWMQPIYDAVDLIRDIDRKSGRSVLSSKFSDDLIQIAPLAFLRGRSIPNSFMIIDESQNLSPKEVKTIVTRSGEGTKLVFTGDVDQIDNPFLDSKSNGFSYLVSKFKPYDIHAHVNLRRCERSRLAEIGSDIL